MKIKRERGRNLSDDCIGLYWNHIKLVRMKRRTIKSFITAKTEQNVILIY